MKGVIKKTKQGLIVKYLNPEFTNQSLPVHPIDADLLKDGDEVEFIVVEEWSEYLSILINYGKIVNHYNETYGSDKEEQKRLITEIMNEDDEDGLYTTVNWGGVIQKIPIETNGNNVEKVPNVANDIFDQELFNYFSQEFNINLLGTEIQDIIDIVKRDISSQTEISDEEYYKDVFYQKQVMNPYPTGDQSYTAYEKGFMDFAKWYREQLRQRK